MRNSHFLFNLFSIPNFRKLEKVRHLTFAFVFRILLIFLYFLCHKNTWMLNICVKLRINTKQTKKPSGVDGCKTAPFSHFLRSNQLLMISHNLFLHGSQDNLYEGQRTSERTAKNVKSLNVKKLPLC